MKGMLKIIGVVTVLLTVSNLCGCNMTRSQVGGVVGAGAGAGIGSAVGGTGGAIIGGAGGALVGSQLAR